MKKIVLKLLMPSLLILSSLKAKGQTGEFLPAGIDLCQHGNWQLVLDEEFNGNSIDNSKWLTHDECWNCSGACCHDSRNEPSKPWFFYWDNNVTVANGICSLALKQEPNTIWNCPEHGNETKDYTAGILKLRDDYMRFSSGKFEAMVKICGKPDAWSTLWLWGGSSGEIDFAESWGPNTDDVMMTIHHDVPGIQQGHSQHLSGLNYPGSPVHTDFSNEWMKYTVEWDRNLIKYYIEGVGASRTFYEPRLSLTNITLPPAPYQPCSTVAGNYIVRPEYLGSNANATLIFSLESSSGSPSGLPGYMQIDYVKVWKRDDCTDNIVMPNSHLFQFPYLNANSIAVGTNNINYGWDNYCPHEWGAAKYEANKIEILPNYKYEPEYYDPDPNNGTSSDNKWGAFIFEAKQCGAHKPSKEASTSVAIASANASNALTVDHAKIKLYPNPNKGDFIVYLDENGAYNMQVVNSVGMVIAEQEIKGNQRNEMLLSNILPPGNYTLLISNSKVKYVEKLSVIK